jgi:hypothetical protein
MRPVATRAGSFVFSSAEKRAHGACSGADQVESAAHPGPQSVGHRCGKDRADADVLHHPANPGSEQSQENIAHAPTCQQPNRPGTRTYILNEV